MSSLVGEVFLGAGGCEHESYSADVEVIHGPDRDAVTLKIGDACICFPSATTLVERLLGTATARPITLVG